MKKHLLFNQSFGTEASPNQTGETLTRENRIGLMSYLRRTLMLLFAVLVMSVANIGVAWGAGTEYTCALSSAYKVVGQDSITYFWTSDGGSSTYKNNVLFFEVPGSTANGSVAVTGSNTADRYLYMYGTNGTVQDNTRGLPMTKNATVYTTFTSGDILTNSTKYYLKLATTYDWKPRSTGPWILSVPRGTSGASDGGYIFNSDVLNTLPAPGITITADGISYNSSIGISHTGYNNWGSTSSASKYYQWAFSSALALGTYSKLRIHVWWGVTSANRAVDLYVNGSKVETRTLTTANTMEEFTYDADANISSIKLVGGGGGGGSVFFRVAVEGIAASGCSAFSFHTGGSDVWNTHEDDHCFELIDEGTKEWRIDDYTRPNHTHYVVNWQGGKYSSGGDNSATFASHSWSDMSLALARSAKVGESAYGVEGSLRIYANSSEENLFVGFIPTGYVVRRGGDNIPMEGTTSSLTETVWLSDLQQITSSNAASALSVGLKTTSSSADYSQTKSVRQIFFQPNSNWKTSSAEFYVYYWGDETAFGDDKMIDPDGDGIYEGWIPSSGVTGFKFVRENPNAEGKPAFGDGKAWNETGNLTAVSGKNLFVLPDDAWSGTTNGESDANWSLYSPHGKYRIWVDNVKKNFHLHFYPHYAITYDANGGSGAPAVQSVAADGNSAARTVAVAAGSGMTAPAGYEFAGWATSDERADARTVDYAAGASYTLTSNATLYAVWTPKNYSITYKDQGDVAFSGTHETGYPTSHTYGSATALKKATKDNYAFAGWYTMSTCTGDAITSIGATAYSSNITLYARWVELDLHEPGTYEAPTSEGGYGRPLRLNSSHDYEVYYVKVDSLNGSPDKGCLYAGSKLIISDGYSMFKIGYQAGTEIKSEDGWVAFKAYKYGGSSGAYCNNDEFRTTENGKMYGSNYARLNNTHYVRMYIQGYDEFAFIGNDNNNTGDNFVVKIDGVTATPSSPAVYAPSTDRHLTRYSISANKPHFIEVLGNSEANNNNFRGFSLRLPDVTRYTVSATNTDGYGTVSPTSVANVRSGSTIYTSSNTLTVGGTTVTATENSSTAQYSYAFNNWTKSDGTSLPGTVTGAITVRANFTQTPVNYTLAWNANGGDALSGTYTSGSTGYGTAITAPNDPTRDGYTFTGWNSATNGSGDDYTGSMPAANTTYYAQWTKLYASGTYQFDGNLTVGTSPNKTVTTSEVSYDAFRIDNLFFSGSKIQFEGTDGTPQGDGDNYMGWKMKTNNSTIKFFLEYDSDVEVSIGGIGSSSSCKISYTDQSSVDHSNTSISAGTNPSYEVKAGTMVTITFTVDEGNKKSVTLKRIAISETAACTNPSASLSDGAYEVLGTALDLRTLWSSSNTTDGVTFTVTNAGGTSGTIAGDGYSFSASAAGSATIRAVQTSTGAYCDADETATITVTMPTYDVTLNANGGTINPGNNVTSYTYGVGATLPTDVTKSGYVFAGWYDNSGLTGDAVTTIADDATGNKAYWAKWIALSSKCVTTNATWFATYEGAHNGSYALLDGVQYDIETLGDDGDGITMGWIDGDEHDTYFHLNIGDLGVIKEVKITIANESHGEGGIYGLVADFYEDDGFTYYIFEEKWGVGDNWIETESVSTGDLSLRPVSGNNNSFVFQTNSATLVITGICIYYEEPCFMMKANTSAASNGSLSHNESVSVGSDNCISLIGGTAKYVNSTGSGTMEVTKDKGWFFNSNDDQIVVTLTEGSFLQSGSVITVAGNAGGNNRGFKVNGVTVFTATGSGNFSGETYTVTGSDTELLNARELTITRSSGSSLRLSSIYVTNCGSCTPISPSLDYSKKSFWMEDATLTATPTLTGNTGGGTVTYSSSNTDAVTVVESGVGAGTITAVGRGTATITASIAKNGGYCDAEVTCDITVKDINCGENVIIEAVRTSGASTEASHDGILYGSSAINTANNGKLSGENKYFGLTLKSGYYFQNGDKLYVKLNAKNGQGDEIVVTSGLDGSGTVIGTLANASQSTDYSNEITLSNVPASTSSIVIYRTLTVTQNPQIDAMKVKRYTCPDSKEFLPTGDDGNWNATANWIGEAGRGASLPTIDDRVIISKPVTVDIADAKAQGVLINLYSGATGKVTVSAGKALIIADKLQKTTTGSDRIATAAADVIINSDRTTNGVGALVIGGETGTNKATVNFETKVKRESGTGNWINQYVGSPFSDNTPYVDYALQLYKFCPKQDGDRTWWQTVKEGDAMTPFWGYDVLYNDKSELTVNWTGTLNASSTKELSGSDMYYNGAYETDNMFANSWLAPIHVGEIEDSDVSDIEKTFYLFNAGTPQQDNNSNINNSNTAAGTYVSMPIHSAEYAGIGVIPAMQGFYVVATGASPSLTLDYEKVVYTPALTAVGIQPNRAPRRTRAEAAPEVITLHVQSETGWAANTYVMGREDFAEGYEDGWDGAYIEGESQTPKLYTPSIDGNMFINCLPQIEGTVVSFRKGSDDSAYTFSFKYDGEEEYYLNDLKEQTSTLINNENTYMFSAEAEDATARFIISATPVQKVTTGVDPASGGQDAKVRKVIINDHIYIIRGGKMYSVDGALVK